MSNYNDTQAVLQQLKPIINQCIENHPEVKSAIKAKKATIESVNSENKTVVVRFPFDTTLVELPYNPQMEGYLTTGTVKGKTVSVWFYQSLSNGIVMQDGTWGVSGIDRFNLLENMSLNKATRAGLCGYSVNCMDKPSNTDGYIIICQYDNRNFAAQIAVDAYGDMYFRRNNSATGEDWNSWKKVSTI